MFEGVDRSIVKDLVRNWAGSSVVASSRRLGNGRPLIGNFQSLDSGMNDRGETEMEATFFIKTS